MFIIVQGGVADDGETFVDILSKVMDTLEEGKDEFYKYVVDNFFHGQDIPRDCVYDEEGLFVDFPNGILSESSDSYTHIELKSLKK